MRIRSTKPEFWRSKTIAALDWDVRLVLKGLESYVDDNGVGKDDIALIAADVFPRDLSGNPPETLRRLSEAISRLSRAGLITRYVFDGEDLLYVERWKELQRIDKPTRGRFPRPDGTMHYADPVIRENYRNAREEDGNPPENYAPGTGEQGNRGTEEQGRESAPTETPPPPTPKPPPRKRGTPLPENWKPTDATIQWAKDEHPHVDLKTAHEKFGNYWRATPGAKGLKLDWDATWRNWIIREGEHRSTNGNGNGARSPTPASDAAAGWLNLTSAAPSLKEIQ